MENFRNFANLDLPTSQGFVVLSGPNGAGKTNFLEAIYFGALLRRFPESKRAQLLKEGAGFFRITIRSEPDEQRQEVFAEVRDAKFFLQYKFNNTSLVRNQYQAVLPVISFLPQDLGLLTRSPGGRRRYLDETLALVSAQYRYAALQYEKALRQRNEILETGGELDIWDEQLAQHGSFITTARESFLRYLNDNLAQVASRLYPELAAVSFSYQMAGAKTKAEFLILLERSRAQDKQRTATGTGAHRDDFVAQIGGKAAVGFLSRGQMRSITLALKILEKEYLEDKLGKTPIMLLDDVFSEFDSLHQENLVNFLKTLPQVFLTTAHLEEVKSFLPRDTQIFDIENGLVKARTVSAPNFAYQNVG